MANGYIHHFNKLNPEQNGRQIICKQYFQMPILERNILCVLHQISLDCSRGPADNKLALVKVMACCQTAITLTIADLLSTGFLETNFIQIWIKIQ